MYLVTSKWIHQNSSSVTGHGFTRDQLAVLGVPWPPRKGWLTGLIGSLITPEQKIAFESFKLISAYKNSAPIRPPQTDSKHYSDTA